MKKYWSLSSIAYLLSSINRTRLITEDAVFRWIREGKLQAERITGNTRGLGKYSFQVEEQQLKEDLHKLGYDIDDLFPEN